MAWNAHWMRTSSCTAGTSVAAGLRLIADAPAFLDEWPFAELFTIADVVAILAEIPLGGSVSRLLTGSGWKGRSGPDMLSLPQA